MPKAPTASCANVCRTATIMRAAATDMSANEMTAAANVTATSSMTASAMAAAVSTMLRQDNGRTR